MAKSRLCSIPGCNKPHYGRGWCQAHHRRWYKHGDPLKLNKTSNGEVIRYFNEVVLTHQGDNCLIWPFAKNPDGRAVFGRGLVCRKICKIKNGPPPTPQHHAAHSCGKGHSGCVNPNHLSWKTAKENNADKLIHGTSRRGKERPNVKLTEDQVRMIRSLRGKLSISETAKKLGVSISGVKNVISRNTWKWLD